MSCLVSGLSEFLLEDGYFHLVLDEADQIADISLAIKILLAIVQGFLLGLLAAVPTPHLQHPVDPPDRHLAVFTTVNQLLLVSHT